MPRKRELGPLDQRRRVARCEACAIRKIKCAGGTPCDACNRRGKACKRRSTEPARAVFVFYEEADDAALILSRVSRDMETIFIDQFFAFLSCNQFAPCPESLGATLLPLVRQSSVLSLVAGAIGALHASRHCSSASYSRAESPQFKALQLYSRTIESLKDALMDQKVSGRDDVLWATFLSGIFELMIDHSGDGWANHMLHGTSRLLQAAHPETSVSSPRKIFNQVFRMFEANRAMVYGGETILDSGGWAIVDTNELPHVAKWDALNTISSLMVQISKFNARFYGYVTELISRDNGDPVLESFGAEAAEIQKRLFQLRDTLLQIEMEDTRHETIPTNLALVYCFYMVIALFNTFDYYACWQLAQTPRLHRLELSACVDQIVRRASVILNTAGGPGLLLLIPLGVAGTRSWQDGQKTSVLALLDRVNVQGFVVANRIKHDLHAYWSLKRS
ncbi:hypothetical protein POX_c03493 [Penicillium oxalicum]|uniref:hypothetical protein n=1 Tax=Penicillium oxalicum TaxID=69781 RepID=UPI0020B888FD|nr:hypothetical protein POX_c03493 [Penicillium oxalicum]KAI2790647.1 hypothetical protein POX_c03493 [Penicillium oxalicum]